jgi:hypothetical protein
MDNKRVLETARFIPVIFHYPLSLFDFLVEGDGVLGVEPLGEGVAEDQTEGGADAPLGVDVSTGVRVCSEGETSPS